MTKTTRLFAGIVAGGLIALHAGIAAAHGSFAFDEPYWKRPVDRASVQQSGTLAEAAKQNRKYDQVDNYNP